MERWIKENLHDQIKNFSGWKIKKKTSSIPSMPRQVESLQFPNIDERFFGKHMIHEALLYDCNILLSYKNDPVMKLLIILNRSSKMKTFTAIHTNVRSLSSSKRFKISAAFPKYTSNCSASWYLESSACGNSHLPRVRIINWDCSKASVQAPTLNNSPFLNNC